jgi:hypothetical protein
MATETKEDPFDGFQSLIEDLTSRLLPRASLRMGIDQKDLRRRLDLRIESSTEINASVEIVEGGEHIVVVVNDALMLFYHKMLKVYVSSLGVEDNEKNEIENPTMSFDKIVKACKDLIDGFWNGKLLTTQGFRLEELSFAQSAILERLLRSCECFDVAHELGHAVIIISNDEVEEYEFAKSIVIDFLCNMVSMNETERNEMIEPWTEEICADLIGLDISLSQENVGPYLNWPNYKQWLCGGAEISHLLNMMLREYYDRMNLGSNILLTSTHPYDYLRWKALSTCPTKASISDRLKYGQRFGAFSLQVLNELFIKNSDGGYTSNKQYFQK